MSDNPAATQIGQLVNQILKLAPEAGLYVGITIKPAPRPSMEKQP